MIDDDALADLQRKINQSLYEQIAQKYEMAETQTNSAQATAVIVSALATNLGMVLAQIPDSHKENFCTMASSIIEYSMLAAIVQVETAKWGQVGHA